jgi:hypothetical protein
MRRISLATASVVILQLAMPASTFAWWDFLEQFSGPRKFYGWDIQLRLFCVVETTKQVIRYVPDPNFRTNPLDPTLKPAWVVQASDEDAIEGRTVAPLGIILSLCRVDPQKEKQRLMFDIGARFMTSNRYEGDTTPEFANGETIHFTTLEPAVMFPLAGGQQGVRLDYGFGAGVYWFSSKGFPSFNGAFLEPIRFDLRIPLKKGGFPAAVIRAGLLYFPAGFDERAWAGSSSRIAAEWVPVYSVSIDLTPPSLEAAKKYRLY